MKKRAAGILLSFVAIGSSAFAQNGTCGDGGLSTIYRCSSVGCRGAFRVTPVSSCADLGNCAFWQYTPVECCGTTYSIFAWAGTCGVARLKDNELKLLAERRNIMVPTCGGAYVPARIAAKQGG